VSAAPRRAASRFAVVGAALSLVAAASGAATTLAADRPASPEATGPNAAGAKPASKAPVRAPAKADEVAVDDDLLEFLGSVGDGGEEGDWLDFLTSTDIDKVANRGAKSPPRGR
jgi:hypothetical protein